MRPAAARLRLMTACLLAGLLLPAASASAAAAPALQVRYPAQESGADMRARYPLAVLELALARSGQPVQLVPAQVQASQERALRLVEDGELLDILWTMTTAERERRLRPVRFPIDRGLIGWRVLLVRKAQARRFAPGTDPKGALALLLGVQGHDWPDLAILRANGLRVASTPRYESVFAMLDRGYVDYAPRSVSEIGDEVTARPGMALAIEPTLLLRYPTALYYFVHPGNARLADAILVGLERAQADGSLEALFQRTYGPALARLALDRRRVLRLRNPLRPPQLPQRADLWYGGAP